MNRRQEKVSGVNGGSMQPGDLVRAREATWRVAGMRRYARVRAMRLVGVDRANRARAWTLLAPFDDVARVENAWWPHVVSRRRWMRGLGALLAEAQAREVPASVVSADVTLLPHQLDPLLALLRGETSRVLVADEVGLGKTVQAVLIVRELRARGRAERVLVVTPAGLRDQWRSELRARGGLASCLADAEWLAAMRKALPADVNPWGMAGVYVASLDFIKQEDVLHGLDRLSWDVVVADEAHALAAGSDRARAVQRIARRSRCVVLLTATPHSGSEVDFNTLCGIGGLGGIGRVEADELVMFRRARSAIGRRGRRVHVLRVAPNEDERRLHELLERYVKRVEGCTRAGDPARLAMAVLRKRACSSAWALERSLRRRWLSIAERGVEPEQVRLPFWSLPEEARGEEADDEEPAAVLGAIGLPVRQERAWLTLLSEVARRASRAESKLAAIGRLLRRTAAGGEAAVVFTEYRDTLMHIGDVLRRGAISCAVLHGGLGAEARRRALEQFVRGDVRVLLTTDAAGEGLNLQQRCRVVVQVEMPWNPIRVEQRIGRVDRIGQQRTVHAWQLIARDTYEERVALVLREKLRRIRGVLGDDGGSSLSVGASVLRRGESEDARRMAERLVWMRKLVRSAPRSLERRLPWVTFVRARDSGRGALANLGPGLVCLWRVRFRAADGALVETRVVALHLSVPLSLEAGRGAVSGVLDEWRGAMERVVGAVSGRACDEVWRGERVWRERWLARDAAIAALVQEDGGGLEQPSLFGEFAPPVREWRRGRREDEEEDQGQGQDRKEDEQEHEEEQEHRQRQKHEQGQEQGQRQEQRQAREAHEGDVRGVAADSQLVMVLAVVSGRKAAA
jgi:superfamily II DNA or RNA helicase